MKLSQTATYAIQALRELAQLPFTEARSCRELAVNGSLPKRFLLQTLRKLVEHDLLTSIRGVDGGYTLRRNAAEITLLQIIEAVDGPLTAIVPELRDGEGQFPRQIQQALERIVAESRQTLAAVSLAALAVRLGKAFC